MNYLTNTQILEYTKYYDTYYNITISNKIVTSNTKRHEINKTVLN